MKEISAMNANDTLLEYTGTEHYHRYMFGLVLTDGVKELADKFKCYWFLDIVASYQHTLIGEDFQVWKLMKNIIDGSATITCSDGNNNILKSQHMDYTDFSADEATVWVVDKVILLPSEY